MLEDEISRKIDSLATWQGQLDDLNKRKSELLAALAQQRVNKVNALIPESVRAAIEKINAEFDKHENEVFEEFAGKEKAAQDNYKKFESEARDAVISLGKSVSATVPIGGYLTQAVLNSGRVTWDTEQLDGLAIVVPQLLALRHQGEPYVTIRRIKKTTKQDEVSK